MDKDIKIGMLTSFTIVAVVLIVSLAFCYNLEMDRRHNASWKQYSEDVSDLRKWCNKLEQKIEGRYRD